MDRRGIVDEIKKGVCEVLDDIPEFALPATMVIFEEAMLEVIDEYKHKSALILQDQFNRMVGLIRDKEVEKND